MAVPRVRFWEFVNEDSRLLGYVKDYYRASLEESPVSYTHLRP